MKFQKLETARRRFDDASVAGALDDAAVTVGDGGVDKVATQALESREHTVLVSGG